MTISGTGLTSGLTFGFDGSDEAKAVDRDKVVAEVDSEDYNADDGASRRRFCREKLQAPEA